MKQLLILVLLATIASAQSISLDVQTDRTSYLPGDTITAAVTITIPEGFHLYANPLGSGIGKPLAVKVSHTDKISWIDGFSDQPQKYQQDKEYWVWQWEKSVHIYVRGVINEGATGSAEYAISLDGLICKESCIPQNKLKSASIVIGSKGKPSFDQSIATARTVAVPFPISIGGSKVASTQKVHEKPVAKAETLSKTETFPVITTPVIDMVSVKRDSSPDTSVSIGSTNSAPLTLPTYTIREAASVLSGGEHSRDYTLGLAIALALLAGFILNFMPCVLPVLGIKILSFSEGKAGTKATAIRNSFAFSLGMFIVFMALATLAAFAGMSWGEQFQNPTFIVIMIALMFLFGLGMFDLFIILVPNKIAEMDQKQDSHSFMGNLAKGVFATLLATPCSGPFLGATLAWTVTQPKLTIYAVFLALGIGMASPYILLASSRRLSRMIPKPGAWMEDFKHVLGFFLFGFAVYLMIGLPHDLVVPTIAFLTFLAGAVILYTRLAPFGSPISKKLIAILATGSILVGGYFVAFSTVREAVSKERISSWQPFKEQLLIEAHEKKQTVIVDFTALWCMNCQFNKKSVYHTAAMDSVIGANNILPMTADLTVSNEKLEQLRSKLGSESIPFLVLFPANDPENPIVFRDLVNKEKLFSVIRSLEK